MIAGIECDIEADVVQSDIPLLLSKTAMKKAIVKLELDNDCAAIFEKDMIYQCTKVHNNVLMTCTAIAHLSRRYKFSSTIIL